jgi:hypothetical protein
MAALTEQLSVPSNTIPPGAPVVVSRARYFQLQKSQLKVDHCSLSRVAVAVFYDGTFTVAFQADQNRRESNDPADANKQRPDVVRQTSHLKRNEFHVRLRFHAEMKLSENTKGVTNGKPVIFEVPLDPFWVQRGQPYPFFQKSHCRDLMEHFDRIDRVEVEFYYR